MRRLLALLTGLVLLTAGCTAAASSPDRQDPRSTDGSVPDEQVFTDSEGTSAPYRVWLPDERPTGFVVILDGDGQWGYEHPDDPYLFAGPEGVAAVGTGHGLAVVAVRTPDVDDNPTWWEDAERNATLLHDLLPALTDELHPSGPDIWLMGYSGGAQQITQTFLPLYADEMGPGGAIILGGGGLPEVDAEPSPGAPPFTMHWFTGQEDTAENSDEGFDALGEARAGSAYYRERGFTVSTDFPAGVGHAVRCWPTHCPYPDPMEPDFRAALQHKRAEVLARVRALDEDFTGIVEASRDSNLDDEHDPEGATIAATREQVSAFLAGGRQQLEEIDRALQRLDAGTYGVCTGCGGPIGDARLMARPAATLCIDCARASTQPRH